MLSLIGIIGLYFLFVFIIKKITDKRTFNLSIGEIMVGFGLKILFGCLYGYIFLHYYEGDDTWAHHHASLNETRLLLKDPLQFFWEYTPGTAIRNGQNFWNILSLYLTDLEYCLIAKTLGYFNIVTRGNYYMNVVLWNFIIFWGHCWLYQLLLNEFPEKRRRLFFCIFLFPPVLFWLSGIRSDGILFFFIGLLFLNYYRLLKHRKFWSVINCIIALFGILIIRSPVVALLLPALLSWYLGSRMKRPVLAFALVYTISLLVFFGSAYIFSSANGPSFVINRQSEFLQLKGTSFRLDPLQPNLKSFLQVLPQAITNTFFRPYPWEWKGILQLGAAAEVCFFWLLVAIAVFKPDMRGKRIITAPMVLSFVFFATSLYLFVGYMVPFPGAIIRYKIVAEVLLVITLAVIIRKFRSN